MTTRKMVVLTIVLILIPLIKSACSNSSSIANLNPDQAGYRQAAQEKTGDLLAFDGHVFVAITKPENDLWQSAGWQIAAQPAPGDDGAVPDDCILYPHQGVDDQWIGSCSGYTFIPRDGANHIAVMHTRPDGTTKMIQVAPPPVAIEP